MKRLVSATLALSLFGSTAAIADPYDHGGPRYDGGYYDQYHRHSNNDGAIIAGIGFLTLAAIIASQSHHHHYHQGWYGRDGYGYGYNRGYGNSYGGGYYGYGDNDRR